MLVFNELGFLTPNCAIDVSVKEFHEIFVRQFPFSITRADLFHEWSKYIKLLRQEIGQPFTQWINGSFISQKQNPKDIDILNLIPAQLYTKHESVLDNFWADNWEREGIDAYFVKVYPESHPYFLTSTHIDLNQWEKRYSLTKPDQNFVQHPKGFLSVRIL